jgi:prolyl-tRNA synthetase
VVALLLRGDHELNAVKAQKLPGVASPLRMASAGDPRAAGSEPGYIGPVGLKCPVYADHAALALADFVCGANEPDMHLTRRQLGARPAAEARRPTCATSSMAMPAHPARGGSGLCAALKSDTSSSWAASTARR